MVSPDEQLKLLDMFVPTVGTVILQYRDEENSKSQQTEHNPPSFLFLCQHTSSDLLRHIHALLLEELTW